MAMPAAAPVAGAQQRVAFVCPPGAPLQLIRDMLVREVVARHHRVLVVAPEFRDDDVRGLDDIGAEHAVCAPDANGLKLFSDWKAIGGLRQVLTDWSPQQVVACGAKTMIYGALAAKSAGAERVVLVVDALPEHRFSGALAPDEMPAWRYGQALRAADEAVFQNRDDLALLRKLALVPEGLPVAIVPGAGVETESRQVLPLPAIGQGLVFLMIASRERRRGVMEYCAAATALRRRAPTSRFLFASLPAESSVAITATELAQHPDVEYLGEAIDHSAALEQCHVFVYPSCAEGMPQPLLQAMTAGRPIVTTNVPGCRDTVDERVNGCFVAPRDADALAEAMESYLKRPDLIPAMARASRAKAERFGTAASVRRTMLELLMLE
ncbi:MAG: glycosyltransferase [Hyphomicrobium sp.]|nr:glycosyltransferase [Hyphomicrobium sp.]